MSFLDDLFSLDDTVAIVTGGAGVLPGAMARTLRKAGARVALWARGTNHPVDDAVSRVCDEAGVTDGVIGVQVDTGDRDAVESAWDRTESQLGAPTLLVNGVGGNKGKSSFVDIDEDVFREVLEMNLLSGLVVPSKVAAKKWMAAGIEGTIINIASMASYLPLSGVWAYDAAKSAVLNLTYAAAKEFAPHGIRVNAVAPGFFIGHQNRRLLIADDETGELTPRGRAIIDHTPFGRFGEMGDLEGTTVFLASRRASGFLTGVCIPVDGGYLVHNV